MNKENITYQSNKLCRKTCKYKRRQSNYKTCKEISFIRQQWDLDEKRQQIIRCNYGASDGAEVWELLGIFLLYKFSLKYNKNNIDLYHGDGLAIFKNISGPKLEKVKKDI